MKVNKMTRTRCTCDFCGKKNWSIGHMKKHEAHCTKNPDRVCRVCSMMELEQKPIADLVALLPDVSSWKDEWENTIYADGSSEIVNEAVKKIHDACEGCPACILSAIRQKGIHVNVATDFDYGKEMKSVWGEINESNLQQCNYGY